MPIVYQAWILRTKLRACPEDRFVFGDNVRRVGMGGQAAAMRGEPNAIGVATKWAPSNAPSAFFRDADPGAWRWLDADLEHVRQALREGRVVHVPRDGLGTGLSRLPTMAPGLYRHLWSAFDAWSPSGCPWEAPMTGSAEAAILRP